MRTRIPVLSAGGIRANRHGTIASGYQVGVGLLCARLRVDSGDDILQTQVDRTDETAGVGLHEIVNCELPAGGNDGFLNALDIQLQNVPFPCPVLVPLIVGQVLEVPGEFTRFRIQGDGCVGEKR